MTTISLPTRVLPPMLFDARRAARVLERNVMAYRRGWVFLVSGFFEPLFYLFSIGVGISKLLTEQLHAPSGAVVSYTAFIAPAMLASSAMNGAVMDSTFMGTLAGMALSFALAFALHPWIPFIKQVGTAVGSSIMTGVLTPAST